MNSVLTLSGDVTVSPVSGVASGVGQVDIPLNVSQTLAFQRYDQYTLTSAAPVSVPFGGLAQITYLHIAVTTAGQIDVQISTVDGGNQIIPVDNLGALEWGCVSKPITALTLIGQANQSIGVEVLMGQSV